MSEPTVIEATALARVEQGSPLPVFQGREMAAALVAYKELQQALDQAMPDAIMQLDGRPYRKKGYWRAVAVAFNLTVEPIDERYEVRGDFNDGRPNFGYIVTYRAVAPNGRAATGDGACFAVEKARRFRCPHPEREGSTRTLHWPPESCPDYDPNYMWAALPAQSTDHNIRGHAHTRAFNRAVSNLVGFGEVSAEEVSRDEHEPSERTSESRQPHQPAQAQTVAPRPDGTAHVTHVYAAEGTKPAKVVFDDGRSGTTFDTKLADAAQAARKAGTLVVPKLDEVHKGDRTFINLTALTEASAAVPEDDLTKPEPEVVETILMTRKIAGANGGKDWWIVQGSEREYLTDDPALEQFADTARKAKSRLLVVAERKRGSRGGVLRQVVSFKPAPDAPAEVPA